MWRQAKRRRYRQLCRHILEGQPDADGGLDCRLHHQLEHNIHESDQAGGPAAHHHDHPRYRRHECRGGQLMSMPMKSQPYAQRGIVLVTAMLLLIVVTIMALSMFRSYGTQERIAGNTRDKQRALNAAISAQQFAESWLAGGFATAKINCVAPLITSNVGQVCSNLPNLNNLPWTSGVVYTQ